VGWNYDTVFFSDQRVRLAMTHIINRESIRKHIYKDIARIVTGPFYILGPQYDANVEPWPYDIARAKGLLDEAGWVDTDGDGIRDKDGAAFRFKFMFPGGGGLGEKLIKLLQDEAAKVGIEVISEPYEWSVFHERLINRDFDSFILGWSAPVLQDPYQLWHSSQVGSHGSNYVGFRNGEADGLIEEARRTLDDDKRNELYHQLHRLLHKEQPYTFLLTRPILEFLDRRFENVRIKNLGVEPHEWYVPKEKQRYK